MVVALVGGPAQAADSTRIAGRDRGFFVMDPTQDPGVVRTYDFAVGTATVIGAYRLFAAEAINLQTLDISGGS